MLPRNVDKGVAKNMDKKLDMWPREPLRKLFLQYDSNRDGRLSREDLKAAFKDLGAIIPCWRAHRALNRADANGDGFVSTEEEIGQLVNYAVELGYVVPN